jgi:hypothetical protein
MAEAKKMRLNTFTCSKFSCLQKKNFDPKNVNNCKKLVIIRIRKLELFLRFLWSKMIFFVK